MATRIGCAVVVAAPWLDAAQREEACDQKICRDRQASAAANCARLTSVVLATLDTQFLNLSGNGVAPDTETDRRIVFAPVSMLQGSLDQD